MINMNEIEFYGKKIPVMKFLGGGYAVVATPMGPAIYNVDNHSISDLWLASHRISKKTRDEAVEAVVQWCKEQPTYPKTEEAP